MKKITKIAATFAATMAILFGAASCSHDGGASLAALSLTDDDDDDKDPPVITVKDYTLSIDSDFPTISSADTNPIKLDDTVTVYATKSGKSIQAYPKAEPPVVKMTGGSATTTAGEEYGLQLTLAADAKITITALTKQGTNAGVQWTLKGMNGASDIDSTGEPAVASADISSNNLKQDTTPATHTFASVPKGTYMFGAKSTGGYLFSLKIEYK